MILRLGPRASRGSAPSPSKMPYGSRPATLTLSYGRQGVRDSAWGGAQPFQGEPSSRPAAPGCGPEEKNVNICKS